MNHAACIQRIDNEWAVVERSTGEVVFRTQSSEMADAWLDLMDEMARSHEMKFRLEMNK